MRHANKKKLDKKNHRTPNHRKMRHANTKKLDKKNHRTPNYRKMRHANEKKLDKKNYRITKSGIRTLGETENYMYLTILKSDTIQKREKEIIKENLKRTRTYRIQNLQEKSHQRNKHLAAPL